MAAVPPRALRAGLRWLLGLGLSGAVHCGGRVAAEQPDGAPGTEDVAVSTTFDEATPPPLTPDTSVEDTLPLDAVIGVDAAGCLGRPTTCIPGDINPAWALPDKTEEVRATCETAVGYQWCCFIDIVFDVDGCAVSITRPTKTCTPAFIDCVDRKVTAERWVCAASLTTSLRTHCDTH